MHKIYYQQIALSPLSTQAYSNYIYGMYSWKVETWRQLPPRNSAVISPCHTGYERLNKKAQLTQGLRATAPSFQDGDCSKMAVSHHLGFYRTANSAFRSADPENPSLEPNMEWIGCTVCEIFAFKLHCDLETGVRGHSRSLKVAS